VKAWAYRGKPVFTNYEDEKPGDILGDGTKGLWVPTLRPHRAWPRHWRLVATPAGTDM